MDTRLPDSTYTDQLIDDEYLDDDINYAIQESLRLKLNEENKLINKEYNEKQIKLKKIKDRKNNLSNLYEKMLLLEYHNKNNLSKSFILLLSIINKYINCEFDYYDIELETYNNILYELSKIRIKDNELEEIKNIFITF